MTREFEVGTEFVLPRSGWIITPAAVIGGLLRQVAPKAPFITASIIGVIGTIAFAATVEEQFAA